MQGERTQPSNDKLIVVYFGDINSLRLLLLFLSMKSKSKKSKVYLTYIHTYCHTIGMMVLGKYKNISKINLQLLIIQNLNSN